MACAKCEGIELQFSQVPVALSDAELDALVDFVGGGLLDPAARPQYLRRLIPERLPSGRAPLRFEFP